MCSTTIRSNQYICDTSPSHQANLTPISPALLFRLFSRYRPCLFRFSTLSPSALCLVPVYLIFLVAQQVCSFLASLYNKVSLPIPLALLFCAAFGSNCDRASVSVWNCGSFRRPSRLEQFWFCYSDASVALISFSFPQFLCDDESEKRSLKKPPDDGGDEGVVAVFVLDKLERACKVDTQTSASSEM